MLTLEQAITEYLKLSRPQFCENNPFVPTILSAAAVSLASRMWIEGTDLVPGVWYIALVGEPRTGKTAILRSYTHLFRNSPVSRISTGSPEAMLKDIDAVGHGFIWYDEVAHLAKLLDSYMGHLLNILNQAYYLDELSQTRTDSKKSVVVEAESYFIHTYFSGTPEDWALIERKATGGFVRRTLVIPVFGIIPFFKKAHKDRAILNYLSQERVIISKILKELTRFDLRVYLPEFPDLAAELTSAQLEREKKSMVEDYFYKLLAGRAIGQLITFDINEDAAHIDASELVHRMQANAERIGVSVEVLGSTSTKVTLDVVLPDPAQQPGDDAKTHSLSEFMPPFSYVLTFKQLLNTITPRISAPDSVIMKNVERIKEWLEAGNPSIVSTRKFVQNILHTTNPQLYKPVLDVLQDGGYIRIIEYPYKGRMAKYVVLDTKARICANCAHYRNPQECPLLKGVFDFKEAAAKVPPWKPACEKFEEVEE